MELVAIEATNLAVGYRNLCLVEDANFRLESGKIICLVGANGAGKTTLMKTLLGRIDPLAGEVIYKGVSIDEMSAAIDHPSFFPYLTGWQNVEVISSFWDLNVDVASVLNNVGINEAAHRRRASKYSTGMKERLELCLALLPQPKFLFLDEPQNGLDPDGMAALTELLMEYRDRGNTIVLSTHLLNEIEGLPDQAILIKNCTLRLVSDLSNTSIRDVYKMV